MATGKTNSRHMRLFLDEIDVSGDTRNVGSFGMTYSEIDVSGWSNGVTNFVLGQPTVMIDGFQSVFNNTATTGSHVELSAQEEYNASLMIGIRGAPAAGDPCFAATLQQSSYTMAGEGALITGISLSGPGQAQLVSNSRTINNCWGQILDPGTALTSTTNGTTVDGGAATTGGLVTYSHVTASSGGTWAYQVQHSTDGSTWVVLGNLDDDGSSTGSNFHRTGASDTVNRYLRIVSTRTSGTCTLAVTAVRQ